MKSAFFSGNNAHLYGIETKKAKKNLQGDRFAELKANYESACPDPSNLRYGYINTIERSGPA